MPRIEDDALDDPVTMRRRPGRMARDVDHDAVRLRKVEHLPVRGPVQIERDARPRTGRLRAYVIHDAHEREVPGSRTNVDSIEVHERPGRAGSYGRRVGRAEPRRLA